MCARCDFVLQYTLPRADEGRTPWTEWTPPSTAHLHGQHMQDHDLNLFPASWDTDNSIFFLSCHADRQQQCTAVKQTLAVTLHFFVPRHQGWEAAAQETGAVALILLQRWSQWEARLMPAQMFAMRSIDHRSDYQKLHAARQGSNFTPRKHKCHE